MRFPIIWTIFGKEIRETLRDRRTLLMVFGLPILLYPLMTLVLTKLQRSRSDAQEARPSTVAYWGAESAILFDQLDSTNRINLERWNGAPESLKNRWGSTLPPAKAGATNAAAPGSTRQGSSAPADPSTPSAAGTSQDAPDSVVQAAREVLAARKADAVLAVWPGFDEALAQGRLAKVSVYFDSVRDDSRKALDRVQGRLEKIRMDAVRARLRSLNLDEGFSEAIEIQPSNVATKRRQAGQMLGAMLPFLLIIMSASGGLYAAIDLTAGEKERNTMQTLLCAPVSYMEIIAGKFLAAWFIVLVTSLANILSLAATFARLSTSMGGLNLPASSYALTFVVLLPVTCTITSVFLAVAVFAKDYKDGQNFLTPVLMLLMLPLATTMLPGMELNLWTAFVPFVNIALLIKSMFLSEAKGDLVFLALVSSAAYAALALMLAAKVFYREQVLLGGKESIKSLLAWRREPGGQPSPGFALVTFAIVLVVAFYASLLLEGVSLIASVLVTQLGFFLAPNLALCAAKGFDLRRTFSLRAPDARSILAAVLIGLSGWCVAGGIATRLVPPSDEFIQQMEKVLKLGSESMPVWVLCLVLGIIPAVCEELLFRGLIFSGLRRWGIWPAMLVSSLLFGLAHASLYRLLPTFLLGLVLGYAAWRSGSILTSMLIHALNNSLLVTFVNNEEWARKLGLESAAVLPWNFTLIGSAVFLAGLVLLKTRPKKPPPG